MLKQTFQQLAELLILTSAETFQQLAFKFYRKWNHLIIDGQSWLCQCQNWTALIYLRKFSLN